MLIERLRARQDEIEQTVLARVHSIASVEGEVVTEPYPEGLRTVVAAGFEYGLEAIADPQGGNTLPAFPPSLLDQVRLAARAGISLDTILRRYLAGYTLLGDFVLEEAQDGVKMPRAELRQVLRTQAMLFDRLVAAVTQQHASEWSEPKPTDEARRLALVIRLLRGELLSVPELSYPLEGHHLGLVLTGPDAHGAIEDLRSSLDRRKLSVRSSD